MKKEYKFLRKHLIELESTIESLEGIEWSLNFPVFLFNRSWFKLQKVSLYELAKELQPDNSQEAPELIQYQKLLDQGRDPLFAIQECWHEFGIEDFHRSLRNSSNWKNKGNNGWTFKTYAELIIKYRKIIDATDLRIPIIILARNTNEEHLLEWASQDCLSELIAVE